MNKGVIQNTGTFQHGVGKLGIIFLFKLMIISNLSAAAEVCIHLYSNETKADKDKELLARLVNFIRGLCMVPAVPSNEPL